MKRRVNVGKDFDAQIKLIGATRERDKEATRTFLARGVFGLAMALLAGAAIFGVFEGSFERLQMVWNAVSVPIGAVIMHYFGKPHA